MDKSKVSNVIDLLITRMRNCQSLSQEQFHTCLHIELSEVERSVLEKLVDVLFDEHIRLTSLINATSALYQVLDEFGLLFDDNK